MQHQVGQIIKGKALISEPFSERVEEIDIMRVIGVKKIGEWLFGDVAEIEAEVLDNRAPEMAGREVGSIYTFSVRYSGDDRF